MSWAEVRFDKGDPHGRRTGDPLEALDEQPAQARIRIANQVVALKLLALEARNDTLARYRTK